MKQDTKPPKKINLWQYQFIVCRRLVWWGALSFILGIPLLFMEPFLQGFGGQALLWGAINAAIAVFATWRITKRRAALSDPADKEALANEANKLSRFLRLMLLCDVVYILLGITLAIALGRKNMWWLGTGIGVIVQGLYLLGFDWYHWKKISTL